MNEKRNIDWTAAFALAARAGPRALVRALQTAVEHERAVAIENFDATFARQRATCEEIIALQRAEHDADLARQRAEYQQQRTALRSELLAKIENELGPMITTLRQELAAANAELARLRAAQPA